MYTKRTVILIFICSYFISCANKEDKINVENIVQEWKGKEIKFPEDMTYTFQGYDTVSYFTNNQYKILTYIDSFGCTSCKLKLNKWIDFINYLDSFTSNKIDYIFIFNPKNRGVKDLKAELYLNNFTKPICLDLKDELNLINNFPTEYDFQTFLLDSNNHVKLIGNPISNSDIKELYLETLLNKKRNDLCKTEIKLLTDSIINLGETSINSTKKTSILLQNRIDTPFVITGIDISCRCIDSKYNKAPIYKNQTNNIIIEYTPKDIGLFKETIIIRGNMNPIKLIIKGKAI